jgi:hypothetical protein
VVEEVAAWPAMLCVDKGNIESIENVSSKAVRNRGLKTLLSRFDGSLVIDMADARLLRCGKVAVSHFP